MRRPHWRKYAKTLSPVKMSSNVYSTGNSYTLFEFSYPFIIVQRIKGDKSYIYQLLCKNMRIIVECLILYCK